MRRRRNLPLRHGPASVLLARAGRAGSPYRSFHVIQLHSLSGSPNMKTLASLRTHLFAPMALAFVLTLSAAPAAQAGDGFRFEQRNLVSDGFIPAEHTDP